jgi:hypothetical protein
MTSERCLANKSLRAQSLRSERAEIKITERERQTERERDRVRDREW